MDGMTQMQPVDVSALQAFAEKVMADIGGAFAVLLAYMGDETGLFGKLRDHGPCSIEALASHAGVDARYLREWLSAQAAAGYVTYEAASEQFSLTPEQAIVLAKEGHPAFLQGICQAVVAQATTHEKAIDIFRSGAGRPWGEHHACCFCGTDRFFRSAYSAYLVDSWLPSLDGVVDKLKAGAKVADIGCGHGSSAVLMAKAFPKSTFIGYDFHAPSVEQAWKNALAAEVDENCRFEVSTANEIPDSDFDLICIFDALHDMGDPVGAARAIRAALKPGGTLMVVEPLAGDSLPENMNLLGQILYSASTLVCTPASRAQEVGLALGAQAGPRRLTEVLNQAGFDQVRVACRSDGNMVLEARR